MATLNDVAEAAGVSPTLVSRYLNHRIELPAATRKRIDEAVARLDYRPNLLAKRLSTGRTESISLVTPEIANPFFAELAAAIEAEAERHGYAVYISSTHGDPARAVDAIRRLADQHVDGLIMMTNRPDDGTLAALLRRHANVVLVDEDVPGVDLPRIFVENENGAYLAAMHLIDAGHRDIALIGGPPGLLSVRERLAGFERAMRERGLPVRPERMLLGDYSRQFGHEALLQLVDRGERPTAILACSDYIAVGVLQAARQRGLAVPADMSLVGFDDMPFAELVDPPLTTVRQPVAEMGRIAFERLVALLGNTEAAPLTRLPVQLVVRRSVARRQDKSP
ncbi:LacI family DNA-binding transcriptional regulator [Mesorhizobium sp. L-8-3]|uniref:LacI family DNA-binding transcriptional regulator n=1 Tax=Mesorhizobium sp. L-8-3 TaxID=2744522 RepID=UPI00192570FF|nr:LacI family DNA-binding transcriptional regulator [Mesorhizobium sp. L-8-3]BCH20283.1 cytochrome-c peroxidase [Mesorhizobium sp. L-8-3]